MNTAVPTLSVMSDGDKVHHVESLKTFDRECHDLGRFKIVQKPISIQNLSLKASNFHLNPHWLPPFPYLKSSILTMHLIIETTIYKSRMM